MSIKFLHRSGKNPAPQSDPKTDQNAPEATRLSYQYGLIVSTIFVTICFLLLGYFSCRPLNLPVVSHRNTLTLQSPGQGVLLSIATPGQIYRGNVVATLLITPESDPEFFQQYREQATKRLQNANALLELRQRLDQGKDRLDQLAEERLRRLKQLEQAKLDYQHALEIDRQIAESAKQVPKPWQLNAAPNQEQTAGEFAQKNAQINLQKALLELKHADFQLKILNRNLTETQQKLDELLQTFAELEFTYNQLRKLPGADPGLRLTPRGLQIELRAPFDGLLVEAPPVANELLAAGSTVATLLPEQPARLTMYWPQKAAADFQTDLEFDLDIGGTRLTAKVRSVSPLLSLLPQKFFPDQPDSGQYFKIELDVPQVPNTLLGGEVGYGQIK